MRKILFFFFQTQSLENISWDDWQAAPQLCFSVLQDAIIEVFPFLTAEDISLVSVSDTSVNSRRLLGGASLTVVFSVAVDAKKADYESGVIAFYSIRDALELVVRNGDLSEYIQHFASVNGVTAMQTATATSVAVLSVEATESDSGAEEVATSLDKQVAIIFAVFIVALLACIVWCCVKGSRQLPGLRYSELDSESTHQSTHTPHALVQRRDGFEEVRAKPAEEEEEVEIELASNPMRAEPADVKV